MPAADNLVYILQTALNRTTTICFHLVNGTEFLSRLTSLANQFEDNNNTEGLQFLSRIVRVILNYHDTRIIDILFSSAFFDTLLKVLKCTCVAIQTRRSTRSSWSTPSCTRTGSTRGG